MNKIPDDVMDIIVDFSIEKKNKDPNKPHEFWILYHNINPWRAINKYLLESYKQNPPAALIQVPICTIS